MNIYMIQQENIHDRVFLGKDRIPVLIKCIVVAKTGGVAKNHVESKKWFGGDKYVFTKPIMLGKWEPDITDSQEFQCIFGNHNIVKVAVELPFILSEEYAD